VRFGLVLVLAGGAACGPTTALDYGRQLFGDPALSSAASNRFACATCHETGAPTGALRPGYTLVDVARRPSFWGGNEVTLRDAVNQCLTELMRGRALTADDEKGRALFVYLRSLGDGTSAFAGALPLTFVRDIVDVPSGDAAAGARLYDVGCATCHGAPNTAAGRLDEAATVIPDDSVREHGDDPLTGARPITIEKVRHGKYFGIGGHMPPFALELLSEAALGDLLAFLQTKGLPPSR
jgi:thiosulfate dehydrogenase